MSLRKQTSLGLAIVLMAFVISCGGGGGSSSSSGGGGSGNGDCASALASEEALCKGNGNDAGGDASGDVSPPVSSVAFDLTGAIGLAIDNSTSANGLRLDGTTTDSSNLKKVNPDNSLSDAVKSGTVRVQSFMVAAKNQVYLLLSSPVESCILVRVDGTTNQATCVDSTLSQVSWRNTYGDPIQFDGAGNIYYTGSTSDGKTVLRENSSGVTANLINEKINLKGFLVLDDGTLFVAGETTPTQARWTHIISPAGSTHSTKTLLNYGPELLSLFPDNNVYIGDQGSSVRRYLTATNEFDPIGWIGSAGLAHYTCPTGITADCYYYSGDSILKMTNGKVYVTLGSAGQRVLAQYYPNPSQASTTVTKITLSKGILNYILLGGSDSRNRNKLMLYDTNTDTETDLLGSENIEAYHVSYLNSNRVNPIFS